MSNNRRLKLREIVEIAKAAGVRHIDEDVVRSALNSGMLPESILDGKTEQGARKQIPIEERSKSEYAPTWEWEKQRKPQRKSVHRIGEKEVPAAGPDMTTSERQRIMDDLKMKHQAKMMEGQGLEINMVDMTPEEYCKEYFEGKAGKRFDDPRFYRELRNLERGEPVDWKGRSGEEADDFWRADKAAEKQLGGGK